MDLNELFEFLKDLNLKIYAIGTNKDKLITLAQNYHVESLKCKNLGDAIKNIDKNLQKDEVALLSPAASSLDEFSSYAQRGNEFKDTILAL